jgi:hypothetical protein
MTEATIAPGCILHWKGFKFRDGETADKFLVIVGAQSGKNYLAIIATSKQKFRTATPGGNHQGGYYHIPGGGKDWFPKDTWLLFDDPRELSAAELVKAAMSGDVTIKGNLRDEIANAICNCMKKCEDVSDFHKDLLGPPQGGPKAKKPN